MQKNARVHVRMSMFLWSCPDCIIWVPLHVAVVLGGFGGILGCFYVCVLCGPWLFYLAWGVFKCRFGTLWEFICAWMDCLYGYICDVWMQLDINGYMWIYLRCLDTFGCIWIYVDICVYVYGYIAWNIQLETDIYIYIVYSYVCVC